MTITVLDLIIYIIIGGSLWMLGYLHGMLDERKASNEYKKKAARALKSATRSQG